MNDFVKLRPGTRPVEIVGVACGAGAQDARCAAGPDALRSQGIAARLQALGINVAWKQTLRIDAVERADPLSSVREVGARLAQQVQKIAEAGGVPLVLGGDHSCAIGTWKGIARALATRGPLGLIWIDAHMDAHTPSTTLSGALHGMPLACLLGYGAQPLTELVDAIRLEPQHVCLVGVRSFEPSEALLLKRLGVRVFLMDEVTNRGLHMVMCEALDIVRRNTAGYGVSVDLDAIDPGDAPAVSTPVSRGIGGSELIAAMGLIAGDPRLAGVEIAEYSPALDKDMATAELTARLVSAALGAATERFEPANLVSMEYRYGAHHYDTFPVVLTRGRGVYLWDASGRRYMDMLSAYSAVSHGHCHPRLTRALFNQSRTLTLTSRVFHNDCLPRFLKCLCDLSGQDLAMPVNTGLEGVEAALKAARKWAHKVKRVPEDHAEIIACNGNFHGRSIAILAMSSEAQYRDGFGPYPAGFTRIPYGDAAALERAITPHTAAFLVEPIQGEGGIIIPPAGYLARCRDVCSRNNVLLICDEVQTGLGRTGRLFASDHEGVKPDGLILGKALGGGLFPVAAFLGRRDVMEVFSAGDHGSTFGGNPLAAAVGLEAIKVALEERFAERAAELGARFIEGLRALHSPLIREVRGRGLLIGVEINHPRVGARDVCLKLLEHGILSKDTHRTVVRFAPPLVITREQIIRAVVAIRRAFAELDEGIGRTA